MPRRERQLAIQLNQFSDALLIAVVFWCAHYFREYLAYAWPLDFAAIAPFRYYKWLYLIILPVCPFVLDVNGYYDRAHSAGLRRVFWILIKSVALSALVVIAAMYFLGLVNLARGVIVLFAGFTVAALLVKDRLVQLYARRHRSHSRYRRPIILVGPKDRNDEFHRLLEDNPEWNLQVVGVIEPTPELLERLPALLHRHAVSCVVFNVTQTSFSEVEKAILACEIEGVEVWLVADFVRTSIARATIDEFHGKPILVFRTAPELSWQLVGKRLIDIVGALLGLAVLGLPMLVLALLIKLTSPGPVLFRQKRSGLHGRLFTMYKFRSMVDNAEMLRIELEAFNEQTGPVFKMAADPRITRVGRYIRKTSIDELPQLWNVLKGDMSLVGPRPPIPTEVEKYDPWHRRRLSMKPGITCLWQISGRNNIPFERWMTLDLQYIDNWSLWLDLKILCRTVPVVLGGFGAH